jgi:hypothetical protein
VYGFADVPYRKYVLNQGNHLARIPAPRAALLAGKMPALPVFRITPETDC